MQLSLEEQRMLLKLGLMMVTHSLLHFPYLLIFFCHHMPVYGSMHAADLFEVYKYLLLQCFHKFFHYHIRRFHLLDQNRWQRPSEFWVEVGWEICVSNIMRHSSTKKDIISYKSTWIYILLCLLCKNKVTARMNVLYNSKKSWLKFFRCSVLITKKMTSKFCNVC